MKYRIKKKLDENKLCIESLQKSEGILTFDELWNKKIYSNVSNILIVYIIFINQQNILI